MAKYLQGDVVLVAYPFTNLSEKKLRPAIVVSNAKVNILKEVILCPITTTEREDNHSFGINKSVLITPLHKENCEARCHILMTIEKDLIQKKISKVKDTEMEKLINKITDNISTQTK